MGGRGLAPRRCHDEKLLTNPQRYALQVGGPWVTSDSHNSFNLRPSLDVFFHEVFKGLSSYVSTDNHSSISSSILAPLA